MRSQTARSTWPLVAFGVLFGAACTNDYDAFLEQASGGGSASSSDATGSGGAASNAGSTATSTGVGSSTSSASTGSGEGGDGNGGTGPGGAGPGGGGAGGSGTGGGEVLPGAIPCDISLPLDVDVDDLDDLDGELPPGWDYFGTGSPFSSISSESFVVEVESSGFALADLYLVLDDPGTFQDCSIATTVLALDGAGDETELSGYIGVFNGTDYLARIRIVDDSPLRHDVLLEDGPDEHSVATGAEDGDVPRKIRIRSHDDDISFDVANAGGAWKQIHTMTRAEVGDIEGVAIGATRRSGGGADEVTRVVLGPLNADP